ncbi:hypothetical protein AXG93_3756s1030 [Marchantia polymorpha subsp. ruderalis]|uniref:Uncharacterized protein n=1 Tax=Marchantia polymorpha subsp. ruderalis TaxID=1480154 RepID=A0A176VG84_MARPO|nr:hypothetical protein AXG93_3756s1030 [Marchantia polymorpha subsp. ruderalis]
MRLTFILRTSYLPIKLHVQIFLRERKVGITVFVLQTATPNYRQQVTVLKSFVGTNWKYSITPDMGIALRHKEHQKLSAAIGSRPGMWSIGPETEAGRWQEGTRRGPATYSRAAEAAAARVDHSHGTAAELQGGNHDTYDTWTRCQVGVWSLLGPVDKSKRHYSPRDSSPRGAAVIRALPAQLVGSSPLRHLSHYRKLLASRQSEKGKRISRARSDGQRAADHHPQSLGPDRPGPTPATPKQRPGRQAGRLAGGGGGGARPREGQESTSGTTCPATAPHQPTGRHIGPRSPAAGRARGMELR